MLARLSNISSTQRSSSPSPYVSRRHGHSNITTTLNTYTHLFDHARDAETVKQRLEEQFGGSLGAVGRDEVEGERVRALPLPQ
jgi:hypothetical protein